MPYALPIAFGLITGIVLLVRGEVGAGLAVLGFTIFLGAIIFSPSAPARLLITSTAAFIFSAAFAYAAVSSEITGRTAEYHSYGRVLAPHSVTRQESPAKFRQCTNWRWALSAAFLGVSFATFRFSRKSETAAWL